MTPLLNEAILLAAEHGGPSRQLLQRLDCTRDREGAGLYASGPTDSKLGTTSQPPARPA